MIFLIHSETTDGTIDANLGLPEYSYYFVLRAFRPLLEEMGLTVAVADPEREVDRLARNARRHGETCVFLSFSPPHRTYVARDCPTIPVFAWEFDAIPTESWDDDPRNDWRTVLAATGRAITHSRFAAEAVTRAMGASYDVASLPAPVWDEYAPLHVPHGVPELGRERTLRVRGRVYDSRSIDFAPYAPLRCPKHVHPALPDHAGSRETERDITLDGVIYSAVFCPLDGRKNWFDMICAFCLAMRERADATLVLKLTHHRCDEVIGAMMKDLAKLPPFACRVVIIDGYLCDDSYRRLAASSHYTLNASHGEGQCLPLMEYMSAGKPAVTPVHSSMRDYVTEENAFLVRSHPEPTSWPHDPRQMYRTLRHRIDFESLMAALDESYRVARTDPARYARMAKAAHEGLRRHCSRAAVRDGLVSLLTALPSVGSGLAKVRA
ncbi:glycosyltransferase [Acidomonas methanolica]|uniref:Glycosyltransferase n=1 Tax=Acidomonas methanolica NBRC 104435 TaxID=1231351 RepID=A0A023D9F0_ACIMT|nr:glycosyltransferase [Acidomonas methanolica]MBU2654203.1 glycosyltransferase [Acidomonas methanolica]TCS29366.1 hypothetical protein EDC31_107140 [Acidomonas methanolica]GAJ30753.1 hypothetical protein Amme_314_003 [Acidomonas methanolica NBRC 104435]GBQ48270.1 hypothetical protein AA0498_0721 [Acidomonas methanolica]GEK99441.1 hypothetical protein AME01nite_19400 [Acidomonas methanolica NBRC 104435]